MNNKCFKIPGHIYTLIENIISLLSIKGLEYILAFITFPYLVRVLQVQNFGLLAYAAGIIQYFILITDFGFNLSGPRDIAQHDNKEGRAIYFSGIMGAKLILLFFSSIIFGGGLYFLSSWYDININLYLATYLLVIGNSLFPIWFFQGIQKMRYLTFVSIIARAISVITIFTFVKSEQDIILAAVFQSIVPLVSAIIAWLFIFKCYREAIIFPSFLVIKNVFKSSWPFFISMFSINVYTASTTVILGIMTNNTVVGYYSAANKVIDSIKGLINPISQAIYPYISKMAVESKDSALHFLKKLFYIMGGFNLCVCLLIFIFSETIVSIILGSSYIESISIFKIMSLLPVIIILSNIMGLFTMLTFGMQKQFSKILLHAAIFDLIIIFPLILFFQGNGAALTMVFTEAFVTYRTWVAIRGSDVYFLK